MKKRKEVQKMYYSVCPYCGSNLDPGEKCTCLSQKIIRSKENNEKMIRERVRQERKHQPELRNNYDRRRFRGGN